MVILGCRFSARLGLTATANSFVEQETLLLLLQPLSCKTGTYCVLTVPGHS